MRLPLAQGRPTVIERASERAETFGRHLRLKWDDPGVRWMFGGATALLLLATIIAVVLHRRLRGATARQNLGHLVQRVRAWWWMALLIAIAIFTNTTVSCIVFGITSFLALREYVTLTPTRRGDHRALFWSFFALLPLQYVLIANDWYATFSIMIPVYAFVFISIRCALGGDPERYLSRVAEIQWGLMVFVYFMSYTPAVLDLRIPGFEGRNVNLLLFLVIVVELSGVLQYFWDKSIGILKICPTVDPVRTWEGAAMGIVTAFLLGVALAWATPFTWFIAGAMAVIIGVAGWGGSVVMSAVLRDRGVFDPDVHLATRAGIIDRVDALCFAVPLFYHLTRFYYGVQPFGQG
jgi:phosphatidate cytidylyltransferase